MNHTKWGVVEWIRKLWRERRPLLIAILVLIVGLPVALTLGLREAASPSAAVDTATQKAQASTQKGDYADAYNKLKAVEKEASTTEQKVALYANLAAAAANVGELQEAIGYLQQKHQLDPDSAAADAFMMARLYVRLDDRADALAQYRLALDYYKNQPQDDPISAQGKAASIQATIDELEAQDE